MIARTELLKAPCWIIMRCLQDESLWEVALNLGNCAIYLPILFESRKEASKYINSASFAFDEGVNYGN